MKQIPLLALRVATAAVGIIAVAENYSQVEFQITTYLSCEGFPRECGVILPYFQYDYAALAGVALLVFSLLAGKALRFTRNHTFWVGLWLFLLGIPLLAEGPVVFANSQGGTAICYGGFACWRIFYQLNLEYWTGIVLIIVGLGAASCGFFLILFNRFRPTWTTTDVVATTSRRRTKRLAAVCILSVVVLTLFFLIPFLPAQFNSTLQQVNGANITCYQIEPSVFPYPIFVYNASASPSVVLVGVGNAVYQGCIVTSPANHSVVAPSESSVAVTFSPSLPTSFVWAAMAGATVLLAILAFLLIRTPGSEMRPAITQRADDIP
jgi:hypothetical protein